MAAADYLDIAGGDKDLGVIINRYGFRWGESTAEICSLGLNSEDQTVWLKTNP